MIVNFEKEYLRELYETGKTSDKKHRFQPHIVDRYAKVIRFMKDSENVIKLQRVGGLRYEKLHGDKQGLSSVRVNDQYRIEFEEIIQNGETVAKIVNITELSNYYK